MRFPACASADASAFLWRERFCPFGLPDRRAGASSTPVPAASRTPPQGGSGSIGQPRGLAKRVLEARHFAFCGNPARWPLRSTSALNGCAALARSRPCAGEPLHIAPVFICLRPPSFHSATTLTHSASPLSALRAERRASRYRAALHSTTALRQIHPGRNAGQRPGRGQHPSVPKPQDHVFRVRHSAFTYRFAPLRNVRRRMRPSHHPSMLATLCPD